MIIAAACTSKLPLSGGNDWTVLCRTSEVTLPVLCASWPLLQGLCQSSRSLARFIPYVDFEFGLPSMAHTSPLELVGADRGCQISRVLPQIFLFGPRAPFRYDENNDDAFDPHYKRRKGRWKAVERLLKACSYIEGAHTCMTIVRFWWSDSCKSAWNWQWGSKSCFDSRAKITTDQKFEACRQQLRLIGLVASIDPERDLVFLSVISKFFICCFF